MTSPVRTYSEVAQALADIPDRRRPGRTVDLLARMLGLTDGEIHQRTGISRTTINNKRTGASPVRAEDLWPLSDALGVEIDVLLMSPSQAATWLVEHRSDELDGPTPGKSDRASTPADQETQGRITHRPRAFPCNHAVVSRHHGRLTSRGHLPHPLPHR